MARRAQHGVKWGFLLILITHLIAIFLFVNGYLLNRIHLSERSEASKYQTCARPYKKVVWIIIDALRYDFVVSDERYPCKNSGGSTSGNGGGGGGGNFNNCPHQGQMPKLQSLLSAHPDTTRTFRYIAEAPTTTTQRLKAMVSGGLPTFFDISNAFTAQPIDEDNLIDQLTQANWSLAFMGDTTWTHLFPTSFTNFSQSFPCFNVKDLDTVDDGIWKIFLPILRRYDTWDALIAHYLGVDHAGHAHGVDSTQMQQKLQQMDEHIAAVVEEMVKQAGDGGVFRDALLMIAGDHGQTMGGDHGGGSPEEVDSVLVAIDIANLAARKSSKENKNKKQSSGGDGRNELEARCIETCTCGADKNQCAPDLPQIDLVPTLAAMLNLPIPFGNMGKFSKDLWSLSADRCSRGDADAVGKSVEKTESSQADLDIALLKAVAVNAEQVHRYLTTYASQTTARFPAAALKKLKSQFHALPPPVLDSEYAALGAVEEYLAFLTEAQVVAQQVWTQFNDVSMILGLGVFAASLALHMRFLWKSLGLLHSGSGNTLSTPTTREIMLVFVPWVGIFIHFGGTFSFFYLLSEGRCTAFILLAVTGLFTVVKPCSFPSVSMSSTSSKTRKTRKNKGAAHLFLLSSQMKLAILGVLAAVCITLSSYLGLLGHSGYGFWQRLTVHEPREDDNNIIIDQDGAPDNKKFWSGRIYSVFNLEALLASTFDLLGPHSIIIVKYLINYGIPSLLILQMIVSKLKRGNGSKSKLFIKASTKSAFEALAERMQRVLISVSFIVLAVHDVLEQVVYKVNSSSNSSNETIQQVGPALEMTLAALLQQALPPSFIINLEEKYSTILHLPLQILLPRIVLLTATASLVLAFLNTVILRSQNRHSSNRQQVSRNDYFSNSIIAVIGSILPIMLLISNTLTPLIALLCSVEAMALTALIAARSRSVVCATATTAAVFSLLQSHVFFVTGHLCEFAGLQYTAGFVGYEEFHLVRSAALVLLDTFGGVAIAGLGLVLASAVIDGQVSVGGLEEENGKNISRRSTRTTATRNESQKDTSASQASTNRTGSLRLLLLLFGLSRAVATFCATVSAGIQRRHLYAWSLFAPRFVFEVLFLALTDVLLLVLGWWTAC